jgi:hypothetical protein
MWRGPVFTFTFGSPLVGNARLAQWMPRGDRILNFALHRDPVPHVLCVLCVSACVCVYVCVCVCSCLSVSVSSVCPSLNVPVYAPRIHSPTHPDAPSPSLARLKRLLYVVGYVSGVDRYTPAGTLIMVGQVSVCTCDFAQAVRFGVCVLAWKASLGDARGC